MDEKRLSEEMVKAFTQALRESTSNSNVKASNMNKRVSDLATMSTIQDTDKLLISNTLGDQGITWQNVVTLIKQEITDSIYDLGIGTVHAFALKKEQIPLNFLVLDGSSYLIAHYPQLYDKIKESLVGINTNSDRTTFTLPNWNHHFLRMDEERKFYDDNKKGIVEEDTIQNITGTFAFTDNNDSSFRVKAFKGIGAFAVSNVSSPKMNSDGGQPTDNSAGEILFDASRVVRTSDETRPQNVNIIWAIQADLQN